MSLEEIQTIDAIDEPIWEELDKKREEYIAIHGERVYDDEEDEWDYILKATTKLVYTKPVWNFLGKCGSKNAKVWKLVFLTHLMKIFIWV